MIHSTVPPGQVNRATVHATVSEFWHVLSGEGQIWRRDGTGEQTTSLETGASIDIPVGTVPVSLHRCRPAPVPLHHDAPLARRQGGDDHRGAVEADCSPRLVTGVTRCGSSPPVAVTTPLMADMPPTFVRPDRFGGS